MINAVSLNSPYGLSFYYIKLSLAEGILLLNLRSESISFPKKELVISRRRIASLSSKGHIMRPHSLSR